MKQELLKQLLIAVQKLSTFINNLAAAQHMQTENSKKLHGFAVHTALGERWCKNKSLGCAETVNNICKAALGEPIGGGASTYLMYDALRNVARFIEVQEPLPGDIVISPSGYGKLPHGHVGIMDDGVTIMSNNSSDGIFKRNFTRASWDLRYKTKGKFPVRFFRPL